MLMALVSLLINVSPLSIISEKITTFNRGLSREGVATAAAAFERAPRN